MNEWVARRAERLITVILILFVALGLAYSVLNPLFEATDELRHYRFVRYVAENGRLPVQGQEPCRSQSHHPPLIYALGALATAGIDTGRDLCYTPPHNPFWAYRYFEVGVDNKNQYLPGYTEAFPWSGMALAAHILRALNVVIGAGTVWLTWAIGRAIWPQRPDLALGGAALVAFNPMFLYLSGAINNDIIAAFSGTAVVLGVVRLLKDGDGLRPRRGVTLGALYGLALLSKFNLAPLALLIEAAVTWVAWRHRQWRAWLVVNLLIGLTTLALAGWWFARNQFLYGEPTGFRILTELWGVRDAGSSFGLAVSELPYAWSSLWGRFGFGQIPLPEPVYTGLLWLAGLSLLGLGLGRTGSWRSRASQTVIVGELILVLDVAILFAVLFNYMLVSPAGPMGRFFFPALPALALLVFAGLSRWRDWLAAVVARRREQAAAGPGMGLALAVNLAMFGLALVALFGYLAPAYARPPAWTAGALLPNPVDIHFDSLVRLRGYEIEPVRTLPGQPVDVSLYWEVMAQPPGDYLLFVHLTDEVGTMVTQRDTHPGLGNFPSRLWRPGDRFIERVRLYIPETAYTPAQATLRIGLYAQGAYRLAVSGAGGEPLGDSYLLPDQIQILPAELPTAQPMTANPLNQNFNNEIRLTGYEYNTRRAAPGDELIVTLNWEPLAGDPGAHLIELRLLDGSGQAQVVVDGSLLTAQQALVERHRLPLPATIAPGNYHFELVVRETAVGQTLPIVGEDGHEISHSLLLAGIRIEP